MGAWGSADARLIRALGNPLRLRILDLVASQGETSPIQLARELEQPLATVSHHVRLLRDLEFVELTRTVPRRGAVEHFYRVARLPFFTDADWDGLPVVLRRGLAAITFRRVFAVAAEAGATGAFDEPGACLSRMTLTLDADGWHELSAALFDLLYRAEQIQRSSDARRRSHEAGDRSDRRSELVIMHFASGDSPVGEDGEAPGARGSLPRRRPPAA
jgi:DNA-binding transcriptional ArsR family regulator